MARSLRIRCRIVYVCIRVPQRRLQRPVCVQVMEDNPKWTEVAVRSNGMAGMSVDPYGLSDENSVTSLGK